MFRATQIGLAIMGGALPIVIIGSGAGLLNQKHDCQGVRQETPGKPGDDACRTSGGGHGGSGGHAGWGRPAASARGGFGGFGGHAGGGGE